MKSQREASGTFTVVGHRCWSRDPESLAEYVLAVTFELMGREIVIYEPLRMAVRELHLLVEQPELKTEVNVDADA